MGSKDMADIKASMHAAVTEGEPPLGFTAPDIITAAHRARRRKRGIYAAVTAGAAAAVAAVTVLALPGGGAGTTAAPSAAPASTPTGSAGTLSLTALTKAAASQQAGNGAAITTKKVEGVTATQVVALVEKAAHARLNGVDASILAPSGELDLAAAIAVAGQPYLNIQVVPAHNLITATPTCAALSDAAAGTGDGYHGPCSIRRLGDGTLLIVRSGTASAGLTMAQATIVRPDGSGVFAEDTNAAQPTIKQYVKLKEQGKFPPATRATPPVGSAALTTLVQAIAARR
jgi:hypothetical protein